MLRLIVLLCAGAYIYSLGHNAAVAPSSIASSAGVAAAKPSMVAGVASAGTAWIAREVHERTAWAAERPAETLTTAQPAPEPPYVPPVAAAFVPPSPVQTERAAAPHRRLQVIIEPAITLAAR